MDALISYAKQIDALLQSGKTLREVSQWSFAEREAGRAVPYLAVVQSNEAREPVELCAAPTAKQKDLKALFDQKAPGCAALKRYTLRVTAAGVEFTERLGRGVLVKNLLS